MTLQAFPKYIKLIKLGHHPSSMGFGEQVKRGDINQFNSRFRLAKSFQRIHLDGYSPETVYGYDAFLKVFLTHSTLERFLEITSLKLDALEPLMIAYNSEKIIQEFVEKDKQDLLYNFIHQRVNEKLKDKLSNCRDFKSANVAHVSAAIRHIFTHGHLCAYSNRIKPKNVYSICNSVSSFLIAFMDSEFTKKIEFYYNQLGFTDL